MKALSLEKVHEIIRLADILYPPDEGPKRRASRFPDATALLAPSKHQEDLVSLIDSLSQEETKELIALAWLGRGEGEWPRDWPALVRHSKIALPDAAFYLVDKRPLAEYLRRGLKLMRRPGPPN